MPDRLGQFLGQLRIHEGVALKKLAQGLCTLSYLHKMENGEREVGKQLADALFQRLGKPAELFDRILDQDEFEQWQQRQSILIALNSGDVAQAQEQARGYQQTASGVLDQQFLKIVAINCADLSGAGNEELLPMVCEALALTQPRFSTTPVDEMLLSQNEGHLLFTYLQLREEREGFDAVAVSYHDLLRYLQGSRYEDRESVYLYPYVALHLLEHEYHAGNPSAALFFCEDALTKLTKERRLYAYDSLLEWKQRLYDTMGNHDRTPEKLLRQLRAIQDQYGIPKTHLLIPCEERGTVYCLNQVIRDRRQLLGLSQEALAAGICTTKTVCRIENQGKKVQRKNRRALLQRLQLSGERYDYEVITDRYEDYLLRSNLSRALTGENWAQAQNLLAQLQCHTPDTPNNQQYLLSSSTKIREVLPPGHAEKITLSERMTLLRQALALTLPLDLEEIDTWREGMLSLNEFFILITISDCYKKEGSYEKSLTVLSYLVRCLKHSKAGISCYEDLYTRAETNRASVLNDLGRYREALTLTQECMEMSLAQNNFNLLASYLYANSCNVEALAEKPGSKEAIELLNRAYAAALLAKDSVAQRSLENYGRKTYGIDLAL